MIALIGIGLVFAAVFGGYILEKGNPWVLLQPAELLIVGGAALGIVMVANRPKVIRKMARGIRAVFSQPRHTRKTFLKCLRMLYEVFVYAQRAGMMGLESEVEEPRKSRLFVRYPELLNDPATLGFLCDSLRMLVIGVTTRAGAGSPDGSGYRDPAARQSGTGERARLDRRRPSRIGDCGGGAGSRHHHASRSAAHLPW